MIVLRLVCKGKILLSILMTHVMCLHKSMQEEDIIDRTNAKCHLSVFLVSL